MQLPIFEKYIDELIEKSTLDVPAWNIEKAREGKAAGWNYIDGCMILALLEIYSATGEKKYYEFADAFIDHRVQEDGTITKYSVEEYNIDNVNAGKTLFALYALNGKEKYRKAIDLIYSQVETQPRTEEGNFWLPENAVLTPLGTFTTQAWHVHSFALEVTYEELLRARENASSSEDSTPECAGWCIVPLADYQPWWAGQRGVSAFRQNNFVTTAGLEFDALCQLVQQRTSG
jgi:uncharacterized protein YyaL (SSP411 family)